MTTEIVVPELGESVVEATVGEWRIKVGDRVKVGDVVVELETDKVDVEVGATAEGIIASILQPTGSDVQIGHVLGVIDSELQGTGEDTSVAIQEKPQVTGSTEDQTEKERATPVARRVAQKEGIDLARIEGSGAAGRVTKQDVVSRLDPEQPVTQASKEQRKVEASPERVVKPVGLSPTTPSNSAINEAREERIRMSRRRRTIAQRLVEAQQTAAMLTTFNEIDMGPVMELRKRQQEAFVARHNIKLGFTSFFVKACIGALKAFPRLNAEIQADEIILKHYYDIGIAVGAEEGLVVPVIRDADRKSFATIESEVRDFAAKSRDGTLSLEDLRGGTFTITNGGVFGSMLSTPILNLPQVGILGLHNIQERPVVRDGQIVIRSMMYVALSYDHRIVDGREAVQFLVRIKELVEDPEVMLLEG